MTSRISASCAVAALWLATASVPLHAQTDLVPALPEVVVTANRSEQTLVSALPHTTVIGRDVIERSQAVDLPSLLASEAGFQFTQNGGRGSASNLFLRGSAGLQVLVLVDGVPITRQDTTGTVRLEHLMLDQVERVEIVRGNVSAIYGSGAIGGVIQVFTRKGRGEPTGYVRAEAGTYGTLRSGAGARGQFGNTSFSLDVSRFITKGFSAMNIEQSPAENPDNDGYKNASYSLAWSHEWSQGQVLGLRSQASDGLFDADGGGSGTATDFFKGRDVMEGWSLYSDNRFTNDWRSQVTLSERRGRSVNDAQDTSYPYDSENVTKSTTWNWTNSIALLDDWLLTAGLETQQQRIVSTDSSGADLRKERNVNSYFGGIAGAVGKHSLQINARRDLVDTPVNETTGYLGYGYQVTTSWKLIASTSTAFNLPPLGYLYDAFSGNAALLPEKARSQELGVQWAQDNHVVRATAFQTRTTNLLLYDTAANMFNNVADASNQGLEVSYSGTVNKVSLRGSLTAQDPKNDTTGLRLARRAKTMASLGASVPYRQWVLGGDMHYTGARPDSGTNPDLPAFTLVNLTARYTLNRALVLTARIDNVFDSNYQTAYCYNQPRRSAFAGFVWTLK